MPWQPSDWPTPLHAISLRGEVVNLEVLTALHEPELLKISQDARIWQYLTSNAGTPDGMHEYVGTSLEDHRSGTALPFIARCAKTGAAIGMIRLKNLSRVHRKGVVGTWFIPPFWGTGANAESKLLVLGHAFEVLSCLRVEFHADSRNLRSRAALKNMGAIQEGILRSDQITIAGDRRDTVMFSVLAEEWPNVRTRLLAKIAAN